MKSTQILRCPSYSGTTVCSYGVPFNNMFSDSGAGSGPRGCSLGAFDSPAETFMVGDSARDDGTPTWFYYSLKKFVHPYTAAGYTNNCIPTPGRHNGGNNCGFCDGHAKWIATSTMESAQWSGWTTQPASIQ